MSYKVIMNSDMASDCASPDKGKIIILSAPSGSGKSTIIQSIISDPELNLGFSISATSRAPRGAEQNGREYYFLTPDEFHSKAERGEFVEWEEVYAGTCYGTLVSEVERVTGSGRNLIMDVDVKGGVNIKKQFGDKALSLFIMPPSVEELNRRLRARATDSEEKITQRIGKAEYEMTFAPEFDHTVINDKLEEAVKHVRDLILNFIKSR